MISESDKSLFRNTVNKDFALDKDAGKEIKPIQTGHNKLFESFNYLSKPNLRAAEPVSYSQSGVSPKTIKKMKQGKLENPPSIDLHGQTVKEACKSLSKFIHYHQNEKFIHVIHGKGSHSENKISILKSQVAHYLKQHPQVLAFSSCPQNSGGTGAMFVYLKS